jgi:hypothetical protein
MLLLLPVLAVGNARTPNSRRSSLQPPASTLLVHLRGGSTATSIPTDTPYSASDKYRMHQIMLLQARSARLREALTERGVLTNVANPDASTKPQPVDWDCALATPRNPRTCLFTFEAQLYTKVVAPIGTEEWISLAALNQLRRKDPKRVEPIWHNKFAINTSWFKPSTSYSMYAHLPWQGYLLTILLDLPWVLNVTSILGILIALHVTRPIWEPFISILLTSTFLWNTWPNWFRYVHAALPFKMFIGQQVLNGLSKGFDILQGRVREHLITIESRIWEAAIPVTAIAPGDEDLVDQMSGGASSGGGGAVDEEDDDGAEDIGEDPEEDEDENEDDEEAVDLDGDGDDDEEEDTGFEMITTFGGEEKRYTF